VGPEEEALLRSPRRPIVLLERREEAAALIAAGEVAPDTRRLGVMLPYTPLHHLLMEGEEVLVMTSANLSEEPLVYREEDAARELVGIADALLTHDRDIVRPCDDSVCAVVRGAPVFIRRSRGYVPRAVPLPGPGAAGTVSGGHAGHGPLFAAGAHEKNVFCLYLAGRAFLSHHIGDLGNVKSVDAYERGVEDFLDMFRALPEAVACDLHPDYASSRFAERLSRRLDVPLVRVQHHHAHIAAVLGEHDLGEEGPAIGVAFDGTGYGPDGTVWGGEFLVVGRGGFSREGHYAPVPMPGGDACVVETDRMAAAFLIAAFGSLEEVPAFGFLEGMDRARLEALQRMVRKGLNTPLTSSCGRLFDAVSALLGLCSRPSYDAQGAVLLETLAGGAAEGIPYDYRIEGGVLGFEPMIRGIVADLRAGADRGGIARRFHRTIIDSAADLCGRIRRRTGISRAALSGGVFQNRLILAGLWERLEREGFAVLLHRQVPPNDGGIAFGQAAAVLMKNQ
ncbi:MAG: Sua5/YciO/YrdC/YwlC family protein, partial [Spirochaetota bacterium]